MLTQLAQITGGIAQIISSPSASETSDLKIHGSFHQKRDCDYSVELRMDGKAKLLVDRHY